MKKILTLLILIVTNNAVAANGSSGYISITDKPIQIISGNDPRVFLYDVVINNSGCSNTKPVLLMGPTQVLAKEMYSTLLTAKSTGKKVNVITSDCWASGAYPVIISIYLE